KDKKSSDVHMEVRKFFVKDQQRRHIEAKLSRLRQWRNQCDYDNKLENLPSIYQSSRAEASKVLKAIGKDI
ncbi:MAG: hypothetical protein R6V10_06385, partial [bacterium]